jgi:hypothetical protein
VCIELHGNRQDELVTRGSPSEQRWHRNQNHYTKTDHCSNYLDQEQIGSYCHRDQLRGNYQGQGTLQRALQLANTAQSCCCQPRQLLKALVEQRRTNWTNGKKGPRRPSYHTAWGPRGSSSGRIAVLQAGPEVLGSLDVVSPICSTTRYTGCSGTKW